MSIKSDITFFHKVRKLNNKSMRLTRRLILVVILMQLCIGWINYFSGNEWVTPLNVAFALFFYFYINKQHKELHLRSNARRFQGLQMALTRHATQKKYE